VALALLARSAGPHRRAEFHGLVFEPRAVLSDMDGVLVDSGVAIEYTWRGFAARHQLDPERVLALVHGRRPVDLIRLVAPHLDADAEAARIEREEIASAAVLRPLPGARELVEVVPAERFAIVTSASRALALARLRAAGIPAPEVLVTAEQVQDGKPDPAGYLSAAQLLGVDPVHCLVLEDAPAGVDAGLAAGMTVIGVLTTNNESSLRRANSRVPDLRALLPKADGPRRRSRPSGTPPPEHDEASQRTPRPADKPCAARLLGSALSDLEHARRSRRAVLHGQEGSEERDSATCRYRGQLGARLTKEFAGSRSCRKDRFVEVANVRAVLDDRLGVPVSLVDDALGLIVVEVDLILQRSGVLGPHDVHGLRGQALELLDLPLVKLEPGDTFYLSQLLRPSSRLRSGEMRRQELSGSVQRRAGFVEDRIKGLEDVRHPGGDVEGDLHVGGGGLAGEADGVVEENLVRSGLDDQGRQAGQVGEDGADEAESGSCPAV
jgi:mannitol-1-/sugar-/sorbitol-6-phosphatase